MNEIDHLIRSLGETPVADDAESKALHVARRSLRAAIAAEQMGRRSSTDGRLHLLAKDGRIRRGARSRRGRMVALFAAVAIIGIAVPALGVADGWFGGGSQIAGIRGSAPPQLTSPSVVVQSGEPDETWTIIIARSNQGLCLNVDVGDEQFNSQNHRLGHCGYSDIRGDLPPDVRGDPSAPCIGLDALVPCGSQPKFALQARAGAYVPEIGRIILVGAAEAKVASVEVILGNGRTVEAEVVERPLGPEVPLNVYWTELGRAEGLTLRRNANGQRMPCKDPTVEMTIARDSQGRVVGRRVPQWNGNPTGDPEGQRPPRSTEKGCE